MSGINSGDYYYWDKNDSVQNNVNNIKSILNNMKVDTLARKNEILILKETIKRHKQRIKELQELTDIYTVKCQDLEQSVPGIKRYKNDKKSMFLETKELFLNDKDWIDQQIMNRKIVLFLRDSKCEIDNYYDDWYYQQIREFDDKQGEMYDYDNCRDEKDKLWLDATNTVMQANKNEHDFMAPRIEQALRRYRATNRY